MSAEYIMAGGNMNVILCERGITHFRDLHQKHPGCFRRSRCIKNLSHLPIIVDPSHADRHLAAW